MSLGSMRLDRNVHGPDVGGSNERGQHEGPNEGMSDIGNALADRLTGDSWNVDWTHDSGIHN